MLAKGEASASLSFFYSLSLSLLPSLENTQGKSVYSYSLSLLLSSFFKKHKVSLFILTLSLSFPLSPLFPKERY
jgi:hypothetical protein